MFLKNSTNSLASRAEPKHRRPRQHGAAALPARAHRDGHARAGSGRGGASFHDSNQNETKATRLSPPRSTSRPATARSPPATTRPTCPRKPSADTTPSRPTISMQQSSWPRCSLCLNLRGERAAVAFWRKCDKSPSTRTGRAKPSYARARENGIETSGPAVLCGIGL